jgi:hypothetical protein
MVITEVTELTHVNVTIKWAQRESLQRLEGLPENRIKMLHYCNANAASQMSSLFKKIGKWKISTG